MMKSVSKAVLAASFLLSLANTAPAFAASPATADAAVSEGEIKKIDTEYSKLTIKHGALKNLGMPAMTMVFVIDDKARLAELKVGDKITFTANNNGGELTASNVQIAK